VLVVALTCWKRIRFALGPAVRVPSRLLCGLPSGGNRPPLRIYYSDELRAGTRSWEAGYKIIFFSSYFVYSTCLTPRGPFVRNAGRQLRWMKSTRQLASLGAISGPGLPSRCHSAWLGFLLFFWHFGPARPTKKPLETASGNGVEWRLHFSTA